MYFSYSHKNSDFRSILLKHYRHFQFSFVLFVLKLNKLRSYDKKFGKFGFNKNGAGVGKMPTKCAMALRLIPVLDRPKS